MTILIFSAGLSVFVVLLVHFAFLFLSHHPYTPQPPMCNISRLLFYYASSQIFISLAGVYENIYLMMKVQFQICPWNVKQSMLAALFLPVRYFSLSRLKKQFKNNLLWQWCCNSIGSPLLSHLSYICSNQGVRNLMDGRASIWFNHLITNWFCD